MAATVATSRNLFDDVVARADYLGALRLFNCKGVVGFVAKAFGIERDVYTGMVLNLLKEDPAGTIAVAMRNAIEG